MENKPLDKKELLLDVAEELFSEHGFEGTSTRMLAKKAGINLAMISYYFGSKEKLFEMLVERKTSYMLEILKALNESESDSFKKIETMIDLYVDRILKNGRFHRILQREISLQQRTELSDKISSLLLRNAKAYADIIQEGIDRGEFRPVDVKLTVATLVGTVSQVTLSTTLVCKLLDAGLDSNITQGEEFKTRVKNYLKDLFRAHLLIKK
jgi:AcrR family transcriptional regulator